MRLVLLGAPGSGKGTQCALIKNKFDIVQVSTGDLFRDNVKNNTPLGLQAKKFMDAGQLVPNEIVQNMLASKLDELGDKSFMLDGFPRTLAQAEFLDDYLARNNKPLNAVIFFDVDDKEIITRLSKRLTCKSCGKIHNQNYSECPSCGGELFKRDDDNEETVKNRLKVFHENNNALLDFYRNKGLLHVIKAVGSPDVIFERVSDIL